MTAKQKAAQLRYKYSTLLDLNTTDALVLQCALISVQEIINSNPHSNPLNTVVSSTMEFWLEVKNEIEKL